jgi:hypothetical protein
MEDPPNRNELQLRSWLAVLRRRWVVLVTTVSVLLALALGYLAFRTPSFVAEAQVRDVHDRHRACGHCGLDARRRGTRRAGPQHRGRRSGSANSWGAT